MLKSKHLSFFKHLHNAHDKYPSLLKDQRLACLFVFWGGVSSHSKIFHSYGDVTSTGEGLHILGLLGLNDLSLSRLLIVFEHLILITRHML